MIYRPRASPLHAARASAASAYCVVLAVVALSFEHPVVLLAVLAAVVAAGHAAGVGRSVLRGLAWTLPFALVIALVNALVVREGLTVLLRLGEVPPFGQVDVTLEALQYGAVLGLRAMAVIGCFVLHSAAVDPDELLRSFRRLGFRSALTAALATRMVPVLARDARRVHDAQRCRADGGVSRTGVVRAVAAGALERATDVAATLEVRGYATARRPPRTPRPWSRHDLAFAGAAVALAAFGIAVAAGGWEEFEAYPRFEAPVGPGVLAICAGVVALMLAPFADRRGIRR